MRAATILPACLLTFAALGLAGCESESKAGTCADVPADVKTVEIHVGTSADGKMYLTPSDASAREGEKVRFKVTNDDAAVFHDVALKDYAGETYEHEVDGGKTVCTYHEGEPYFTATAKGAFAMYCEVAGHKAAGMSGTFTVA